MGTTTTASSMQTAPSQLVLQPVRIFLLHSLPLLCLSFLSGRMNMLEFENSIADALAYFQSARIPRNTFKGLGILGFWEDSCCSWTESALNYARLISRDFLKLRVQVNLQYSCIILYNLVTTEPLMNRDVTSPQHQSGDLLVRLGEFYRLTVLMWTLPEARSKCPSADTSSPETLQWGWWNMSSPYENLSCIFHVDLKTFSSPFQHEILVVEILKSSRFGRCSVFTRSRKDFFQTE